MRYFIALDFYEADREKFHGLAQTLKKHSEKARIVEADHVHLTLAFLGEINPEQVKKAEATVQAVDAEPFTLVFDTVSYFNPKKGGRIFWIGPDAHPALDTLQKTVHSELLNQGFALDERPFTPHVTLARGVRIKTEDASDFEADFEPFRVNVPSVSLIVSKFKAGKLVYETLTTKTLEKHSQ
ncbi:MAG: RNA 2',3'-cyclic phosphodiesterase [Bacillota bacterium]